MTTAVLATCFAADNMSSGGTSRGSCEPLVVSRHFLAAQNPEQKLWDVNWFGDFLMGLLVCKKKSVGDFKDSRFFFRRF